MLVSEEVGQDLGTTYGLRMLEKSKFFDALKVPLMWALYNKRELWDQIGYPGPSIPFGGYINRGFDDIDWLPT